MTIKPVVRIVERKLVVKERTILTNVSENVVATSNAAAGQVEGVFLGAVFDQDSNRHVVSLGTLRDVRFLACFRFKLWWMAQKMGDKGRDIPLETQFLLVETKNGSHSEPDIDEQEENKIVYTVFLPLVEGPFKACLQGNDGDELELCLESGDSDTVGSTFTHLVYISSGTDPFGMIHDAIKAVKLHLGSFRMRNEKKLPGIVDYFGWCTWDAFYQEVTQEGVEAGLESLKAGGTPPKFVIIDDGWQSVASDEHHHHHHHHQERLEQQLGQPRLLRLTGIKENAKFQKGDPSMGIKNIVNIAKEKHGLKYVYVWHAITGYWGGVKPGVKEMEEYESAMQYPKLCKGVMENEPGWKTDAIALQGLGLVNPKNVYKFYNELHSYLTSAGVDGVKVDAQCILETLGAGHGGRVELTKQYHQALDASIARNFSDNGCIACMSHNLESLYCSKQTAIVRASDDFFPRDPVSHTIHIAAVAYNSVFLGEIMLPDWDMFHSVHSAAEYHGSARAISGGAVYVSSKQTAIVRASDDFFPRNPVSHTIHIAAVAYNSLFLGEFMLPDWDMFHSLHPAAKYHGSARAISGGPIYVSLLKIWNMNKYTGVLGVYNCQGAAWNSIEKKSTFHQTNSEAITGYIRGRDVHLIEEYSFDSNWNGEVALYSCMTGELKTLHCNVALPVSLKILEHEIFTITPIKTLTLGFSFAPLGLIDMFNAGGAIECLKYDITDLKALVSMEVKGCGRFGAYSSSKPKTCTVGSSGVEFEFNSTSGL
ncbi:UNVERIFIED_CONTAM: putative galactinol--sucrose galactosyltransferase 6 [Sesamum radiatum]|uniref:galactinol--sucrose galactosyltransferase n=1 Tax=Sesamum radiatum TaxID=300843 RepID=A0AAW2NAC8_SESRA